MIQTFSDKATAALFLGSFVRSLPSQIQHAALRKLKMLDAANVLADLLAPPGNRLEALTGDRAGQHSIRINGQWRICFVWNNGHAFDVEIVDYH